MIVVGQSIAAAPIVPLRRTREAALAVAASLAQIGEFSFILGAIAGALLSFVLAPFVLRLSAGQRNPLSATALR